jgi:hypothetical protein
LANAQSTTSSIPELFSSQVEYVVDSSTILIVNEQNNLNFLEIIQNDFLFLDIKTVSQNVIQVSKKPDIPTQELAYFEELAFNNSSNFLTALRLISTKDTIYLLNRFSFRITEVNNKWWLLDSLIRNDIIVDYSINSFGIHRVKTTNPFQSLNLCLMMKNDSSLKWIFPDVLSSDPSC